MKEPSSKTSVLIFVLLLFGAALFAPSVSLAAVYEDATRMTGSFLDNIENWVIQTGLPDTKKELWEKHNLLIKPFFKWRYDLTNNVFKAPDTGADHTDNLWTFTPGFQWLFKSDIGVIGGAYEASFRYFTQFSDQNAQDQKFLVYANLNPTENTYLRASEKLTREEATAGGTGFEPIDFTDNIVNAVGGYKIDEVYTVELGYENFDRDFSPVIANRYNFNEDKYDLKFYDQITDDVRLYTGFRLGNVDFYQDSTRDTVYYEFPVGFEGKLPFYDINTLASVGIHHRNLEAGHRNDITHVVANISLQKTVNHDRTSFEAGFLRRPVESAFSTATTYDEKLWYTSVKHLMTPKLRARVNFYMGNRDFEERVFTGTRFVVGGAVFVAPANQVKRNDDVIGFGFGFDYNVRKWLIFHLDYQYSRRDSNISTLDYTENVFSLGSTIPL